MKLFLMAVVFSLLSNGTVTAQIIAHYSSEPSTTAELVEQSDAVVRGRVEQKRFDNGNRVFKAPMTEYRLKVTEVLKADGRVRVGDVITVYRFGGERQGKSDPEAGFLPFAVTDDLIMFLDWAPVAQVYLPYHGPDGAYKVVDGRIKSFGPGTVAKLNEGKYADDLSAEVRNLNK